MLCGVAFGLWRGSLRERVGEVGGWLSWKVEGRYWLVVEEEVRGGDWAVAVLLVAIVRTGL